MKYYNSKFINKFYIFIYTTYTKDIWKYLIYQQLMVPMAGVEPAQLSPLPPQDSVSTNSTTSACVNLGYLFHLENYYYQLDLKNPWLHLQRLIFHLR